jgi:ABC-type lipoprotein release transport system permease subunit
VTIAGAIVIVTLAGLAASLIPARRASHVEIATMMREN